MRADNARNSIQSGRRPASRAQAYGQESTTTSTITSTSTSIPSHAVGVDVDVNEFSRRLICTSWSAWPLALVVQGESSCPRDGSANAGRHAKNSIKAVHVQLLVQPAVYDNVHDYVDVHVHVHARRPRVVQ